MDEIKKLPDVAKIDGFIIRKAQSPENSSVLLRYSDQQQDAYELAMPLLEALYLLNLLDAASKREGYDSLRQLIRERKKYS